MTDKQTKAPPITVDGVTFRCYHTGILQYEWRSSDGRCRVRSNHRLTAYHAAVDGKYIEGSSRAPSISAAKAFRKQKNAMRAAVNVAKKNPPKEMDPQQCPPR